MRLLFAENQPQLRRSAREYALLEYLIRNKGIILSREQIENNLWNYDYAGGTNVVDVYICAKSWTAATRKNCCTRSGAWAGC